MSSNHGSSSTAHPPRPAHAPAIFQAALPLVFLGGALGTLLRFGAQRGSDAAFTALWGSSGSALAHMAWVLPVNLLGAFLLALLYTAVPPRVLSGWAKPLLGTGLLGGFTSYSTLALDLVSLSRSSWVWAAVYIVLSLLGGLACAALGAAFGCRIGSRNSARLASSPQADEHREGSRP